MKVWRKLKPKVVYGVEDEMTPTTVQLICIMIGIFIGMAISALLVFWNMAHCRGWLP